MRNPDWVRDEIILAMNLYVRAGRKQLPPSHKEVVSLSQLLNRLPLHPSASRDENFRNPNGVSMILGNFLGVDPVHNQPGLSRNNHLQAAVWADFIDNPDLLLRTAQSIEVASGLKNATETNETIADEDVFPEGLILTRQHVVRERNRAAVSAKIDAVMRETGRLACQACGFDFFLFYGELGRAFSECHHVVPLSEVALQRKTRLTDLAIVCANCHRMLHRVRPAISIESLRCLVEFERTRVRSITT
jgi:5-methylcytosine-specific restriction protein A